MQKTCANSWCAQSYEVTDKDLAFYRKVSPVLEGKRYDISPPKLCPDCRMQRRLSFRNQTTLYKRKCDVTGAEIISIYSQEKPHKVVAPEVWWSDQWDPMSYGKDVDTSRSFIDQFRQIMQAVPHIGVLNVNSENSDFTNQTYNCRNCYLSSAIKDSEDCLYVHNCNRLVSSIDCSFCFDSQLLCQCTDTFHSYHCSFLANCIQCSDSEFLYDCIGCQSCFGCTSLRNKQYCFFNKECTKEQYEEKRNAYASEKYSGQREMLHTFVEFLHAKPRLFAWLKNCEQSTGDNIQGSKKSSHCFDCNDLEDCKYSSWIFESKDCHDCYGMGVSELVYDCVGVEEVQRTAFSLGTSSSSDCYYTDLCFNCQNCIGCVALKKKQYCILNKQYTKEAYEALAGKIIEGMQARGEWGEFFPSSVSAFAYNETKGFEHFPLSKEQAISYGWKWKDDVDQIPQTERIIPAAQLPDSLDDIPDDVLNWAIQCERTGRPFLISKQELSFYRKWRFPVPHLHPNERQRDRLAQRNPQKLWKRACGKCGKPMETTYSPERSEKVYCEECYLKEVY